MKPKFASALLFRLVAAIAIWQLSPIATAEAPIWANAKWVKATDTTCGGLHYLVLKGASATVPTRPNSPGCTASEEIYHQINVSKKFFQAGNNGDISASHVEAGYIFCRKGEAAINLGAPGEAERAIREHPVPPGCTYTKRQYQHISSVGSIPFTNVVNGGTMSVAESLAMHAKEREQAIAECNASPACQAEVRRMSSSSGSSYNPCTGSGIYSIYSGGRCENVYGKTEPEVRNASPQ